MIALRAWNFQTLFHETLEASRALCVCVLMFSPVPGTCVC